MRTLADLVDKKILLRSDIPDVYYYGTLIGIEDDGSLILTELESISAKGKE
jgi:hypothetical protein